ncbi:MAG TPA: fimbrial protein [Steroidobacteraceae bacterium]|jgi:type 1 fimbria pilin|nr:fimbrial protein [Steroidobacteraceae bacterium]
MRRRTGWLQRVLAPGAFSLLLSVVGAPALAQTVNFSPATLSFSPAGPYSVPRDAAVGSQVAHALAAATATGITCALIETATVNGTEISAGSGVYQTSVSGIGVSFYVVNGGSQTLITSTSGGYTSGTIGAPGNGALPGIQANLIVTGQVVSGYSLSGLPTVTVTFTPTGACSWSTGIANTLATNANNSAVVPITCIVTTPSVSVNLPVISLDALSAVGKTGGDTRFPIGLSCASGATVYITLSDVTTPANASALLTLAPSSTAQGIKLRILNSAGPIDFGPDSAAPGTTHQWLLGASSSIAGIPLTVQYYRDDTNPAGTGSSVLSAGSVHAQATFTMSYQ